MKLTALVERVDHVCCRYRLTAFQPALKAAGHTLDLIELPKTLLARLRLYRSMGSSDAVVLQRTLLNRFELHHLRSHARQLIFDFDDAIWLRDSYSANPKSRKRLRRFQATLQAADIAFAGNDFLAEHAKRYCGDVRTIPTCVETHGARSISERTTTLVWIGSASTLNSLERIRPTLETLGRNFPNLKLKLISDRFARFDPLIVENVMWDAATESAELVAADIGIATMPDDDWSRGKCGLKVLQYMAAGLPVIANAVGVHSEMIQHGETGTLANTTAEWIAAVDALQDLARRNRFGINGQRVVRDHYSVSVGARLWLDALQRPALRIAC